jgi:Na+-driven multidrug efflux pump
MTQVTGAAANMVLDPFFIFKAGNIKFAGMQLYMPFGLNMGVRGAAVATAIAQLISFGIVLFYYSRGKSPVRLHLRNLRPRISVLAKISAIGSSSFALQCAASLVQIIANLQLARHGGDLAISAMTLVNSIAMFCILPIIGIVQGIQPIIGYNYGAKNYRRVRETYFFAVMLTSIMTISASVILQSFPGQLVAMFNDDPELVALTSQAMRLVLFILPFLGFQIVSANLFQFIGKSFVSLIMTLLRQIILLIPLYFILPRFLGLQGVWLASPISDTVSIIITVAVISRELHWLNQKIKQQKIQFINEG